MNSDIGQERWGGALRGHPFAEWTKPFYFSAEIGGVTSARRNSLEKTSC